MSKTNTQNPSRDAYVRELRERAEKAADASLHHAELSQRYMQLSQKLTSIAEQADTYGLSTLQRSVDQIEAELQSLPQAVQSTTQAAHNSLSLDSDNSSLQTAGVIPTATAKVTTTTAATSGESEVANPPGQTRSETVGKRATIRTLVQRFRSAKLAGRRRVRVKAKKSDLKPRQRTASEELKKGGSSLVTAIALFSLVLIALNFVTWQLEIELPIEPIVCSFAAEETPAEESQPIEPPDDEIGEQTEVETEEPVEEPPEPVVEPEPEPVEEEEIPDEPVITEESSETDNSEMQPEDTTEVVAESNSEANESGEKIDNRSESGKKLLIEKYGGSAASESAVKHGLEWLLSVQHPQGYWDFINVGAAGNPGTVNNPIGGTAYALLPFLAAGQTHKEGSFQKQVGAGLTYLTRVGVNAPAGYDLRGMINKASDDKEPNEAYYVHGAATLVLCEAYGMTKDRRLKRPAEGAIQFIVNSQDPNGGGWRYNPRDPGSTSVTAIQVMALMAARKAGLKVPDKVLDGVRHYLDSVQVDKEGRYGYEIQKKRYTGAVTSMALLCRMYLGWGRDDGDLRAGIALLDKAGPYENLYSLYFATQVMKNWGGDEWERWNARLRDDLIAAQEKDGPAKGSWKPRTGAIHAKQGGRLLSTSLATLTLQVYYRYEPLLSE